MWFSSSSLKAKRTSLCDLCTQHLRNYLRCANNSTVEAAIVENNSVITWCLIIANKMIKSRRPGCVTRFKMVASTVEFFARLKTAFQKVAIVNSLNSQNKIIVRHHLINALQKLNEKWHGFWKLSFFNDKDGLKFKCMNWLREAIRFYTKGLLVLKSVSIFFIDQMLTLMFDWCAQYKWWIFPCWKISSMPSLWTVWLTVIFNCRGLTIWIS